MSEDTNHDLDTKVLDRVVDALDKLCKNFEERLKEQVAEYICENSELLKTSDSRVNQVAPNSVGIKDGRCQFKSNGLEELQKIKQEEFMKLKQDSS